MSSSKYPSWLNAEYFQSILASNLKNSSVLVRDVEIEPCGAADGFLSTLLRIKVHYRVNSVDETEIFISKMLSSQELAVEKVGANGYNVQDKEINFFEVIAPQMRKILSKIEDETDLFPRAIHIDHEHSVLIFNDLKVDEFVMADRMQGLDTAHTELSMKKTAKFHAASLIIHQKHPRVFDNFDVGMFSRKVKAFNPAFESIFGVVVEEVKTWSGYEKYAEKLDVLQKYFVENATRCFDFDEKDFCVLNHGDLWTNNLMFRYDARGEVTEAILVSFTSFESTKSLISRFLSQIDFQFCHWGSPALDLIHFLYTSLNDELYCQDEIEGFVQFYYDELKETLKKLDYDFANFPSLQEFQIEMLRQSFYGESTWRVLSSFHVWCHSSFRLYDDGLPNHDQRRCGQRFHCSSLGGRKSDGIQTENGKRGEIPEDCEADAAGVRSDGDFGHALRAESLILGSKSFIHLKSIK